MVEPTDVPLGKLRMLQPTAVTSAWREREGVRKELEQAHFKILVAHSFRGRRSELLVSHSDPVDIVSALARTFESVFIRVP